MECCKLLSHFLAQCVSPVCLISSKCSQHNNCPFNPLNPIVHFWLHHTAHCAEKIVSARLRSGSASAERVGQGEVGGVTGRVLCTWWLLGLALKRPWLVPGGPPPALTAWTGLENTTLTLQGLVSGKKGCLVSERVYGNQ